MFAAVAGGIYLLVQKSGTTLLANTPLEGGLHERPGTGPEGGNFDKGQPPSGNQRSSGGDFNRGGEAGGFSTRNLSELGLNIGKVALITIGVGLIPGLIRVIKRRKQVTRASEA